MLEAISKVKVTALNAKNPHDVAAVVALLEAQLDEHEIPRPTGPGAVSEVVKGMLERPERGFILIAKDGEIPVGVAYLSATWTLEKGGPALWLEELYVKPELRCQGIGEKLLKSAMQESRERGYVSIDLEVEESHSRAQNLYYRHEFVALPRRRFTRWLTDSAVAGS